MCIIANKGFYYTPHIIKKIGNSTQHANKFKKKNYTTVRKEIFDLVYDGMQDVVERGTAAGAKVPGIAICGKTGTAQNPHGKDHSLFVAFAPRENPRIAIGLMVENGGWGASWAAPIGTLMIEKYLNDSVKRKDLEKRMMEGVVYPPHYRKLAAGEEESSDKDADKKKETDTKNEAMKTPSKPEVKSNQKTASKADTKQNTASSTDKKENNKSSKKESSTKEKNKDKQGTLPESNQVKSDNKANTDKEKSNKKNSSAKERNQRDSKPTDEKENRNKSTDTKPATDTPKEPKP